MMTNSDTEFHIDFLNVMKSAGKMCLVCPCFFLTISNDTNADFNHYIEFFFMQIIYYSIVRQLD